MKLDLIDRRLLTLLQTDNSTPLDQMAEDVGSSRSSVQRRIRRLKKEGIIRKEVALLERKTIDGLETFIVHLQLRREKSKLLDSFHRDIEALPEVQQCYVTTGVINCMVFVLLPNTEALEAFTKRHFSDNSIVCCYFTCLITKYLKAGMTIPVRATPLRPEEMVT